MCGITLLLTQSFGPRDDKAFRESCKAIRHRGPDLSGLWQSADRTISCGHERLAIVRPDSGEQPLVSADGQVVLIVNGEIYNYLQLAETYGIDRESLATDCDIILKLYDHDAFKGDIRKLLAQLHGVFAMCIVDQRRQLVFVARDRLGVDPLYAGYGADAGVIMMSSELKGITPHSGVARVEQFPPGHLLTLDLQHGIRQLAQTLTATHSVSVSGLDHTLFDYECYWKLSASTVANMDFAVAKQHVHDQVVAAIQMRLDVCDVPLGCLLSGGLDSSIVSAIAAKSMRKGNTAWSSTDGRLHTFAVGMVGAPDLAAARIVAEHLDSIHHEFTFTLQRGLHALRDVIGALETYDVTTIRSSVPMSLLTRMVKAHGLKVILSGEGADELFGGYLYFHHAPDADEFQAECLRKVEQLYHYDVARANKICAMYGVEVRVPFLDQRVTEMVLNELPADLKRPQPRRAGEQPIEKQILRAAFEEYLPEEICWRQKEQFSDGCGVGWIEQIKEHAECEISDQRFAERIVRYPFQTPTTKEAMFYRDIFEDIFAGSPVASGQPCCSTVFVQPSVACSTETALRWCGEAQGNVVDPSGRAVLSKW